ncbi:DUF6318 family protein [Rothia sp. P5766]|uniref:DUF6318 family protein n=1 Tax=Rothia sp. P5766 TaxID=3402656 RepID=UPI003AE6CD7B
MTASLFPSAALGFALVLSLSGCVLQAPQPEKTGYQKAEQSTSSTPSASSSPSPQSTLGTQPSVSPHDSAGRVTPSQSVSPRLHGKTTEGPKTELAPPVADPGARQQTADGLYLFAEHWAETFNYAVETGDFKPLEDTLSPRVSPRWSEIIASRKDVYTIKGWIEGNTMSISRLNSPLADVGKGAQGMVISLELTDGLMRGTDPRTGREYTYDIEGDPAMEVVFIAEYIEGNWKFITTTEGSKPGQ